MTELYTVGVDLGQVNDHSAMVITRVDKFSETLRSFTVKDLHKWPLGTEYKVVAEEIAEACRRLIEQGAKIESVTVDATGVGRAFVELIGRVIEAKGLGFTGVPVHIYE